MITAAGAGYRGGVPSLRAGHGDGLAGRLWQGGAGARAGADRQLRHHRLGRVILTRSVLVHSEALTFKTEKRMRMIYTNHI